MKASKTRKKAIARLGLKNNSIRNKDRIVNSIVFTVAFCITIFLVSKIV